MPDTVADLAALKQGDERAWRQAFEALWGCAMHAALRAPAGLAADEAEDVAMEAFTQLVPHIGAVSTPGQLKALLVTIAHRQAISLARRKSAAKRPDIAVHLESLPDGQGEALLNRGLRENPFSEVEAAELLDLLHQSLAETDPATRQLLAGQHFEGLTINELSRRTGLPAGTVSVKLARGLRRIRARLEESPRLLKELRAFLR